MDFVVVFALGISVTVALTIIEGRKDHRRQALGIGFRQSPDHSGD